MLYFVMWLTSVLFVIYLFNSCSGGSDMPEPAPGPRRGTGVDCPS